MTPWTPCPATPAPTASTGLCWLSGRKDLQEARQDLGFLNRAQTTQVPKRGHWVEADIEEMPTFYCLSVQAGPPVQPSPPPLPHERLREEIRRRTRVVRLFPNAESCFRWERGLPGRIEKSRQGCGDGRVA